MSKFFKIDKENKKFTLFGEFDENSIREQPHFTHDSYYVIENSDGTKRLDMITRQGLESVYDTLIYAAAKYTDRFASDILYDIRHVETIMQNPLDYLDRETWRARYYKHTFDLYTPSKFQENDVTLPILFGIRQNGVDGNDYIHSKLINWDINDNGYCKELELYYRAIYLLEIHIVLTNDNPNGPIIDVNTAFGRLH